MQSSYAYSAIRAQLEYSFDHHDSQSSQFSSSVAAISIRVSESVNQASRVDNQHTRSTLLSASVSNHHVRFSSSSVSASMIQNSTSMNETFYETTQSRFEQNFFKKLSQLNKIYKNDEKFKNTDDNFDFKLKIFVNKCKRVGLFAHAYMKEIAFMLANRTLFHFYVNEYENIIFDQFRIDMQRFFEESE
jgi:hypothetical protein